MVEVEGGVCGQAVEIVAHLLENPWSSEGGASHHHGIHAVAFERLLGLFDFRQTRIAMLRAETVEELTAILEHCRAMLKERQ